MMKNKRVILHIGTMKTGSSSIQQTLGRNREKLLKYDIYYPEIKPYNHLFKFTPIFLDEPALEPVLAKRSKDFWDVEKECMKYKALWVSEFEKCTSGDFIISAENLSLPSFNGNAVVRLKEFLELYFEEVVIVVYIRHFNTIIKSQAQQMIKNGFETKSFKMWMDFFLNDEKSDVLYSNNLKEWIKIFGKEKIVVRPFDSGVLINGSLVDDFLMSAGIFHDDMDIEEVRANDSIGKYSLAFLERYNIKYPVLKDGRKNSKRGLAARYFPVHLLADCVDEAFEFEMKYSGEQAKKLNGEIDYINDFFDDDYQFEHVIQKNGESTFPSIEKIPCEYYLDLINSYNKEIEKYLIQNEKFIKEKNEIVYALMKSYESIGKSKSKIFMNVFRYFYYKFSGLTGFDKTYYIETYPYVRARAKDPLLHFIVRGVFLGYNPNEKFDTNEYIEKYPEIVAKGENALIHNNRCGNPKLR